MHAIHLRIHIEQATLLIRQRPSFHPPMQLSPGMVWVNVAHKVWYESETKIVRVQVKVTEREERILAKYITKS